MELLGWKYVGEFIVYYIFIIYCFKQEVAYEEEEKYKEGKYILEKVKMKHCHDWR